MTTRTPIVAGQFYPAGEDQCRNEAEHYLAARPIEVALPERIVAGIVPHAGWFFSGDVAGMVFNALKQAGQEVRTCILLGASHRYGGAVPAVWPDGQWRTPLGDVAVDAVLADQVMQQTDAEARPEAHAAEHSIEVQVPLLQVAFPSAQILPIVVPARCQAVRFGQRLADVVTDRPDVVCIASTDLTHYGPRYGFTPAGRGAKGLAWARNVNDAQFIRDAVAGNAQAVQADGVESLSACGPGAAAAAVALAGRLGRGQGTLLAHTTSADVLERLGETSEEAVGYAAIVY